MKKRISYQQFRSNALQSLTLIKHQKNNTLNTYNKDQIERWIIGQYEKHYGRSSLHKEFKNNP